MQIQKLNEIKLIINDENLNFTFFVFFEFDQY